MANVAKLLLLQGGLCFYCREKLPAADATADHVVPKALGGDSSEGNLVACCRAINSAFGHASPKEKLAALIASGGRLECPGKVMKNAEAEASVATVPTSGAGVQASLPPKRAEPKTSKPLDELRKPLREAFQAAAAKNGGGKANLAAVGVELRKRVDGFAVKAYGYATFGKLVSALGYRVEDKWLLKPS